MIDGPDDRFDGLDVELYWADVTELESGERAEIESMMSPDERRRGRRIRHPGSKRCHLVTRRLVRRVLSTKGERRPGAWRFDIGEFGRPRLANPTPTIEDLDFNIAHSDRRVVMALTFEGRVGVDLEPVDREIDAELVAEKFFHDSERAVIGGLDGSRRRHRFLQLWVIKEAWMKADGRGIGAGLDEVIVEFDDSDSPRLVALPESDVDRWRVAIDVVDDHLVAVCHRRNDAGQLSR